MDLNEYVKNCHKIALEHGFWEKSTSIPTKLMLIVTELGEACEADRHDDKENFKEELADVFIRLADLVGWLGIDMEEEVSKKMAINKDRPRLHGKEY